MGTFNNKIEAEFTPPKKWVLSRSLSYQNYDIDMSALEAIGVKTDASKIKCSKGFITDLASTPKALWWMIAPWDIARAAIIHDQLYWAIRQYRAKPDHDKKLVGPAKVAADKVFKEAMKDADPKVPGWKIYAAWKAVDLFGRWSIIPRKEDKTNK